MGNFGNRLAQSLFIALALATAAWFGIAFGIAGGFMTLEQQYAGTGMMFFCGVGIGLAKDTGDNATTTK